MGKIIAIIVAIVLIGSCMEKMPSEEQKAYNALVEKNRAIENANPGWELAALQCGQLGDIQEKVGQERARNGLDTKGYTRTEAYRTCMQNKGYGHLVGNSDKNKDSVRTVEKLPSQSSESSVEALAKEKGCLSCHAIDKKIIGPSFKMVAEKYRNKPNAPKMLAKRIIKGGVGVWGKTPEPPNNLSDEESLKLVEWALMTGSK